MNDYYERNGSGEEMEQSASYKSTEAAAATYQKDGEPAKISGIEWVRVCSRCGTIYSSSRRECEVCGVRLSAPMTIEDAEDINSKKRSEDSMSNKGEKIWRRIFLVIAIAAILFSVAAYVLSKLIGVEDPTSYYTSPTGTAILMILNLAGMAIIIMCWILPSTSRRIVENRKRRRERRRAGHYDTYEDTSNIGPLFIVMLIPVASVIFSISNIFSIINDAFHLF